MSARPEPRVLTDPQAIKALAHPARLTVLDALTEGEELTATECAEVAGISPSAMSYHLRALEKWGFVERAETSTDGRERPWRSLGGRWSVDSPTRRVVHPRCTLQSSISARRARSWSFWQARPAIRGFMKRAFWRWVVLWPTLALEGGGTATLA